MENTSLTLLNRLRQANDVDAWQRLFGLYQPLLIVWLRKYDVQSADADDLAQDVLVSVSKNLVSFDHNGRSGAFRTWLRRILVNRLRTFWRSRDRRPPTQGNSRFEERLAELEDEASAMSQMWNRQHDLYVLKKLLELSRPGFSPETWLAFTRVALHGERPDFVAKEIGMSLNAVFIAKSRVLSKLRAEAAGLVNSSTPSERHRTEGLQQWLLVE